MVAQHVSPEDAVKASIDTRSKVMIPMHYSAYRLADDAPKEALDRLPAEWEKRKLDGQKLAVMRLEETIQMETLLLKVKKSPYR